MQHETEIEIKTKEKTSKKSGYIIKFEVAVTILAFISLFVLALLGAVIILLAILLLIAGK